jgi:hypothetical protein
MLAEKAVANAAEVEKAYGGVAGVILPSSCFAIIF